MEKLVSVIIPAYNAEKSIEKCALSLLEGSYNNIELIIVNDGSVDNTEKQVKKLAEKDSRVKVFSQENSGVSAARNKGMEIARGELIAFVDSDDYVEKGYISDLYKMLVESDSDLAVNSFKGRDINISDCVVDFVLNTEKDKENFLKLNENFLIYGPVIKLYKSSIIKENSISFPPFISYGEDLLFNCEYIKKCKRIAFRDCKNYHYIDVQQSLSNIYREDRLENGLLVNNAIREMFKALDMLTPGAEYYIQNRVFDDAYNSAFETWSKEFEGGIIKKIKRTKQIFNNREVFLSTAFIDENKYSPKILNTFKHKSYVLFTAKMLLKR